MGSGAADEAEAPPALRRLGCGLKALDNAGVVWLLFISASTLFAVAFFFAYFFGGDPLVRAYSALGFDIAAATRGDGDGDGGEVGSCDWSEGEWVWDERYPLYEARDCPFLDEGFRCSENGRPDRLYTKWRWRPSRCNLPRFDAKAMLEKLRNRRVVFVGDSLGRNQWESFLCMLSMAVPDKSSIYEVNGSPITKHKGFLVFKFRDYNCTVEYYREPFLVAQSHAPAGVPEKVKMTLKLDSMDWSSKYWKNADILVFNTGHWWNNDKISSKGIYFQFGEKVKMEMSVDDAYKRSLQTLFKWIKNEVDRNKTQVIFRTYAPAHFIGGDWRTGGSCHLETLPELSPVTSLEPWAPYMEPLEHVPLGNSSASEVLELDLLNVTQMSAQRKDGHSSIFYLGPSQRAPYNKQDCSHWCLPGVPDAWNEILYAMSMKREAMRQRNTTFIGNTRVQMSS